MKNEYIYFLIGCLAVQLWTVSARAESEFGQNLVLADPLQVFLKRAIIENVSLPQNSGVSLALRIDLELHNSSENLKLDIPKIPSAAVYDEYQNQYRLITREELPAFTLYPGQKKQFSFLFELPVEAAQRLELSFDAPFLKQGEPFSLSFERNCISAGATLAAEAQAESEREAEKLRGDFNIQYPLNQQAFHPGEKVFVRVDLKNITKQPNKIHVLAFNNLFTDDQAVGRYEIRVPEKAECQSNVPVVIMIEWDSGGTEPDIISKTVSISIIPNKS